MSKKDKKQEPANGSGDPFVELDRWVIRHSDIRAFFAQREDNTGRETGKTVICISCFAHPVVIDLTLEQVKALVRPQ